MNKKTKLKKLLLVFFAALISFSVLSIPLYTMAVGQNLSSFTEVDTPNRLTVTDDKVEFDGWQRTDEIRLFKDFGIGYFSDVLVHNFTLNVSSLDSGFYGDIYMLSNSLKDHQQHYTDNSSFIAVTLSLFGGTDIDLTLQGEATAGSSIRLLASTYLGTNLYCTVYIDDTIGADGTAYLYVYSDAARTVQLDFTSIALAASDALFYRYLYAINGYDDMDLSNAATGHIEDLDLLGMGFRPTVVTYPEASTSIGATLYGYAIADDAITNRWFMQGTESGNYTDNFTATVFDAPDVNSFYYFIPTANLTIGQTYYFRAYAENAYGTSYGSEQSYIFYPSQLAVTITGLNYLQLVTGNSTAIWYVQVQSNPVIGFADNVTTRVSTNPSTWANPIEVELISAVSESYLYQTVYADGQGLLLPDTVYYFQGVAYKDEIAYYSTIHSIMTESFTLPDRPTVDIVDIADISNQYDSAFYNYVFEVTARVSSENNTDLSWNEGVEIAQYITSVGMLQPPTYTFYNSNGIQPDNTFTMTFSFSSSSWYAGETLYFRAFLNTVNYGYVYSRIVSYTPASDSGDGIDTTPAGDIPIVSDFSLIVAQIKANLGLVGLMGTWAFMGLILLIIALLFGSAFCLASNPMGKTAIGFTWLLISIAVVGGFIFTGELGIWPILILVGSVVILIMIIVGVRLSGGQVVNG